MPNVTDEQRHKVNTDPIVGAYIPIFDFQEDNELGVIRVCRNNEDLVFEGYTYTALDIDYELPASDDAAPGVTLKVSNITRAVGSTLFNARNRIGCRIRLIDTGASPYEAIIDSKNLLIIQRVSGDSENLDIKLTSRMSFAEPVPYVRTSKLTFPGVWFEK